jgi:hypothetical protein
MEYTPPLGVGRYDAIFQVVSGGFVISSEARDMIVDECGYEDFGRFDGFDHTAVRCGRRYELTAIIRSSAPSGGILHRGLGYVIFSEH